MKKYFWAAALVLAAVLVLPLAGNAANYSTFSSFTIDNVNQGSSLYKGVTSITLRWNGALQAGRNVDILVCPKDAATLIVGRAVGRCFYMIQGLSAINGQYTTIVPETTPTRGERLNDKPVRFVIRDTNFGNGCSTEDGCLRSYYYDGVGSICGTNKGCLQTGYVNLVTANNSARDLGFSGIPSVVKAGDRISAQVTAYNNGAATWNNLAFNSPGDYSIGVWGTANNSNTFTKDYTAFGSHRFAPNTETVPPGSTGTFLPSSSSGAGTFTAPTTPGAYKLKFQMVKEWVAWFGPVSAEARVTVIPNSISNISSAGSTWYRDESRTINWSTQGFTSGTKYSVDLCPSVAKSGCVSLASGLTGGSYTASAVPASFTETRGYIQVTATVPNPDNSASPIIVTGVISSPVTIGVKNPNIANLAFSANTPDTANNPWLAGTAKTITFQCSDLPAGKYYKVYFTAGGTVLADSSATIPATSLCSNGTKTVKLNVSSPAFYSSSNSSDNGYIRLNVVVTSDAAGNQVLSAGTLTTLSTQPFRFKASGTPGLNTLVVADAGTGANLALGEDKAVKISQLAASLESLRSIIEGMR